MTGGKDWHLPEKTLLLVDDDPEIVKSVRHYLQQEGYDVPVAYNGLDALITVRFHPPKLCPALLTAYTALIRHAIERRVALVWGW
jgi:CheY-like chemotaxis protein